MLSFIVPAYNEEFELGATLAAIHAAATGHDYEIIVVDDASTDRTAEIARVAGARVVPINRRHIAASRNAGAQAAGGEVLFFVDADTRINSRHVTGALDALAAGFAGGGCRVKVHGPVPLWSRVFLVFFCAIYFGLKFGAGAFLFTTRQNFDRVGGFDETVFVGEEVFFSLAMRKLGRFTILREPMITSGRKLRMYSTWQLLRHSFAMLINPMQLARNRERLAIWYDGKRESG
jgi:glycosyltransferase involved in cell wall biosynthesis